MTGHERTRLETVLDRLVQAGQYAMAAHASDQVAAAVAELRAVLASDAVKPTTRLEDTVGGKVDPRGECVWVPVVALQTLARDLERCAATTEIPLAIPSQAASQIRALITLGQSGVADPPADPLSLGRASLVVARETLAKLVNRPDYAVLVGPVGRKVVEEVLQRLSGVLKGDPLITKGNPQPAAAEVLDRTPPVKGDPRPAGYAVLDRTPIPKVQISSSCEALDDQGQWRAVPLEEPDAGAALSELAETMNADSIELLEQAGDLNPRQEVTEPPRIEHAPTHQHGDWIREVQTYVRTVDLARVAGFFELLGRIEALETENRELRKLVEQTEDYINRTGSSFAVKLNEHNSHWTASYARIEKELAKVQGELLSLRMSVAASGVLGGGC